MGFEACCAGDERGSGGDGGGRGEPRVFSANRMIVERLGASRAHRSSWMAGKQAGGVARRVTRVGVYIVPIAGDESSIRLTVYQAVITLVE